ncbi:MAG: site-specific DNA-methyltransferase [Methanobacteriota archaeon]|nr:MAG: site-specific DNA-methyltransferase [Euryarchaeota archaeon]
MTHLSENSIPLTIEYISVTRQETIQTLLEKFNDVCLLVLPLPPQGQRRNSAEVISHLIDKVVNNLGPQSTLITVGETVDLVHVHAKLAQSMQYQLWIAIKRTHPKVFEDKSALPEYHFGALVHTKYKGSLKHTKTRIKYTYCPACEKTTKDYGGKKHTYNSYGTLMSDVWRDISADLEDDLNNIFERFADLFGIEDYSRLLILDCRKLEQDIVIEERARYTVQTSFFAPSQKNVDQSRLILGDCLDELRKLPDNSIDFAFADPPYNLRKKYNSYSDDLSITEYFNWCDEWISELARVLRPGRTCAVLNIPLWDIRHFLHMEKILHFQNWIVWDALSFPVRLIMPAHYGIICFSKGPARPLPGLANPPQEFNLNNLPPSFHPLEPLAEGFCLRSSCVRSRQQLKMDDRGPLTDLWWDIHRLKHNSRRVDHPCQLPPQLMYRLISIFTEPGEVVLDCFNGTGTTTLTAHQLNRQYIGIEISEKYHKIAENRHREILQGLDPFRKAKRKLTEKNSPVERLPERNYEVPKKTLQLEVRRVAKLLGKIPNRDEMIQYGKYPIKYYDEYFVSWGEVCAAARHDGMNENKDDNGHITEPTIKQLELFE